MLSVLTAKLNTDAHSPCLPQINHLSVQFSSVTQLCPTLCELHGLKHARPPCPSPTPRVYSNSCPLSLWCHPAISSSVVPFSSLPSVFPSIRVFSNESVLRISTGVSASTPVLPVNIQSWFLLGLTGLISLLSKGLSRVFSNTTVQKYQFFGTQHSLQPNTHIHTWLLEKQ